MNDSASSKVPARAPEQFEPPEITNLASLTDGRQPGEFKSVYPASAWLQIIAEFFYLLLIQLSCFAGLTLLALYVVRLQKEGIIFNLLGPYPASAALVSYISITLSGACGGCTFALKWLYHTVAKKQWHRDRSIWRFVVPISSAMMAIFSGLMIISGLVPLLSKTPLLVPTTGAAYGFLVGLFSDNVLAALQRLAFNVFGTVDDSRTKRPEQSGSSSSGGAT